uniref:Uncharacterized protein n=1 Tax=Glossina austeni TaxID=7395 RepID=A0A1A9UP45_GLOAU
MRISSYDKGDEKKSTHGVDGPVSWRLTLDQDLIDTLKGSFPSWFQQTTTTTTNQGVTSSATIAATAASTIAISKNIDLDHQQNEARNNNNFASSNSGAIGITLINNTVCASPITIDGNSYLKGGNNTGNDVGANCLLSSSSSSSSSYSSSSSSISYTSKQYIKTPKSLSSSSPFSSSSSSSCPLSSSPCLAVSAATATRVIPKSPSLHSLGGSLLATFSSSGSATFEIISDSSCNGLLTSHLSGKSAFEHSFQDVILLQEIYDDMSEGEQRLNTSFLSGSSDDGTNSDFYDPRQSPPKAIVDSSPLQPAMDKNKEFVELHRLGADMVKMAHKTFKNMQRWFGLVETHETYRPCNC